MQLPVGLGELEMQVLHAVRQTLKMMGVYHAPWQIIIEKKGDTKMAVTAWLPENVTLPRGYKRPLLPVYFLHQQRDAMREFTDVAYAPIARELGKEINKAYKLGEDYGRL